MRTRATVTPSAATGLHAHGGERMPRVAREIVGEPSGHDISQLDDKLARVGLRGDIRHGLGRLDGNDAGAFVDRDAIFFERCRLGTPARWRSSGGLGGDRQQPRTAPVLSSVAWSINSGLGLSEHLAHLALLLERERIVDLLHNHHVVLRDGPDRAVQQLVAGPDDDTSSGRRPARSPTNPSRPRIVPRRVTSLTPSPAMPAGRDPGTALRRLRHVAAGSRRDRAVPRGCKRSRMAR